MPAAAAGAVRTRYTLRDPGRALPRGTYDLTVADGTVRFAPAGRMPGEPPSPPGVALVWADRSEEGLRLLLLTPEGAVRVGDAALPGLAATAPTEKEALEILPAGRWLEGLLELPVSGRPGRTFVATDVGTLDLAARVAEEWLPWMDREGLRTAVWFRPGPAAELASSIRDLLEDLPFVASSTRERWRDATVVLEATGGLRAVLVAG